jgi:hypothetical protein
MTIGKTQTTGPGRTRLASNGGIRRAVLRYLRWRAVSQLRRLDARTLQASGIHAEDILAVISGAESERLASTREDLAANLRASRPH